MRLLRPDPIIIEAPELPKTPEDASAVIFLHGLGDDGESFRDLVSQYHNAYKLPHTKWVLPTAKENRDIMGRAWYLPSRLTARPAPRPELEDDEDREGIMESCEYIGTLIDSLVSEGIPMGRIAVGGFSQGCAVSLILGLCSKYAGKLAGIFGLMGYLPLADQVSEIKQELAPGADIARLPVYICRGTADILIPSRYHQICVAKLRELEIRRVVEREHKTGHTITGIVINEVGGFLEEVFSHKLSD